MALLKINKNTKGIQLVAQAAGIEVNRTNAVRFIAMSSIFDKLAKKAKEILKDEEHDFITDGETEISVNRSVTHKKVAHSSPEIAKLTNQIKKITEEQIVPIQEKIKKLQSLQIESGHYDEIDSYRFMIDKSI